VCRERCILPTQELYFMSRPKEQVVNLYVHLCSNDKSEKLEN